MSFLRRVRALEAFAANGTPTGYEQDEIVKTKYFELVGKYVFRVASLGSATDWAPFCAHAGSHAAICSAVNCSPDASLLCRLPKALSR